MRIRSTGLRLAIPVVVIGLVMSGCSSNTGEETGSNTLGQGSDINAHPSSDLKEGGNLRLPVSALPVNFNILSNDGNDVDTVGIVAPLLPQSFVSDATGKLTSDPDYFTKIELTKTAPQQVVTYTINPKAVWSDGSPITWEDMKAQADALSGKTDDFLIAANAGFDRVEKVERGVDDRQAVITFNKPYAEWKSQYGVLYPKSVTATPESFNTSLIDHAPLSAGPFMVKSIDQTQKRLVLGRNPLWWGATPKLDTITFLELDNAALLPALANNEIDAVDDILTLDQLQSARKSAGVAIRRAASLSWSHITFNGAPGALLEDPRLRSAIAKAIDRKNIAAVTQNGLVPDPKELNNHVYVEGQTGYQDNSASVAFDPDQAAKELDQLGWKLVGGVREKDGRKLEIRDVFYQTDKWTRTAQVLQQNLAKVGVKVIPDPRTGDGFFSDVIKPGQFDITTYSLSGSLFPLSGLLQLYAYDPANQRSNFGRIGSPELNQLIDDTISELDPVKAREMANEVDKKVFEEVHSLPIYQWAGITAVRQNVANYGAFGLATADYTKIGFLK